MVLYGAGGHAKVILEILKSNNVAIEAIYDDNPEIQSVLGNRVLAIFDFKHHQQAEFIVSIGSNLIRKKVVSKLLGLTFGKAVDPLSRISDSAIIRQGTVVMPGAIINAGSIVGDHCIVNSGVIIEHDCRLGDFVHIAPNATLCGDISVGEGTLVGAGAVVLPGVKIGAGVTIGAGSVVLNNLQNGCTAVGNPAKVVRD